MAEKQTDLIKPEEFVFRISSGEKVTARGGDSDLGFFIDNAPFLVRNTRPLLTPKDEAGLRTQRERQYGQRPRKGPQGYIAFYVEAKGLNPHSHDANISKKRESLAIHFPYRFGSKGRQHIESMTNLQVGSLYDKMTRYSEKFVPTPSL